jgi:hypothetical protein
MSETVSGPALADLLRLLRSRFEAARDRSDAVGAEIGTVLAGLDRICSTPLGWPPTHHPLIRFLPEAVDRLALLAPEIADVLGRIGPDLPWRYGYVARPDQPGLEAAMGWAEIVGPTAPFPSDRVCFGLTLIGPDTHYLPHRHPAVELYHVLSGTAAWSAEDETALRPPGSFILHPANLVHAMRTGSEPLLALYSWTGDVVSPSVWADHSFDPVEPR